MLLFFYYHLLSLSPSPLPLLSSSIIKSTFLDKLNVVLRLRGDFFCVISQQTKKRNKFRIRNGRCSDEHQLSTFLSRGLSRLDSNPSPRDQQSSDLPLCYHQLVMKIQQESLNEGEGSVQLTSLYQFKSARFNTENVIYLYHRTSDLNEEVNCTKPSPQVVFLAQEFKCLTMTYFFTSPLSMCDITINFDHKQHEIK